MAGLKSRPFKATPIDTASEQQILFADDNKKSKKQVLRVAQDDMFVRDDIFIWLICLGECVGFAVDFFRACGMGVEDDAVAEGCRVVPFDGEVEGGLFGVEDAAA